MTISCQHKEMLGSNKVSQDDCMEGTSARTRPISYDDIMLRRKTREDAAKQVVGVQAHIASSRDYIEKVPHSPESHGQRNEDFITTNTKYTSDDSQKLSSWNKGDIGASNRDEKLVEDKDIVFQDTKFKLKSIISSNRASESKSEAHNNQNRKKDGISTYDYDDGSYHRVNHFGRKELISERSTKKSKLNRKVLDNEDEQVYRNRKTDKFTTGDREKDSKKRTGRDIIHTDNISDRRDKSEKETKHKRHDEEDKTRGRTAGKKPDSEIKGIELVGAHQEKSKVRRNRSQSRERDKYRGKRSPSHSPKEHKHSSKYKRYHGESPSHFSKDRPTRDHSDVVNKRISSNGSSSHKRRTVSSSGLGGYSPRKRKTNAAAKTPSPSRCSLEEKFAGWDLPPDGKDSIVAGSTFSLHASDQNLTMNVNEFPRGFPVTPAIVKPIGISHLTLSSQMHAVDSIQLTQATRPMRRLYIDNLPASSTEKDLMECINNLFLSSGFSYVQGTQPCISCIMHKEKGQALLEFLTPEDASVALSFGGKLFFGCNLRLRRPKDYTEVTTGPPDKALVAVDSVSNVVEDSLHKIFIGGISKVVSSKMLLEIARVFGPLKAYHFKFIGDSDEPCAFLEYVDHSVTSKACAGLTGIRLGGQVVTAVIATPDAALLENVGKLPSYGIPEVAKPLLVNPTSVLKLQNMLDPEGLLSLSDTGLEEIMEDIKLECSRFGVVTSINVIKPTSSSGMVEAYEVQKVNASIDRCGLEFDGVNYIKEQLYGSADEVEEDRLEEPQEIPSEFENSNRTMEDNKGVDESVEPENIKRFTVIGDGFSEEIVAEKSVKNETCKPSSVDRNASLKDPPFQENFGGCNVQSTNKLNDSEVEFDYSDKSANTIPMTNTEKPFVKDELISDNDAKITNLVALDCNARKGANAPEYGGNKDTLYDLEDLFEPGSVLVEYKRAEAACTAAHCLHGRLFDGRVVAVSYVDHDLYRRRFDR